MAIHSKQAITVEGHSIHYGIKKRGVVLFLCVYRTLLLGPWMSSIELNPVAIQCQITKNKNKQKQLEGHTCRNHYTHCGTKIK